MPIIDNAVYVDGHRTEDPASPDQTAALAADRGGFAWTGLYRPTDAELEAAATMFGLHHLAVEDARVGHQRPKLERYGQNRFVVLRPARYLDADETVEFGEVHLFVGPRFIVAVRRAEMPDLTDVRHALEARPDLMACGPLAVLYGIVDRVVDEYAPVAAGLENDIDEIEDQLFEGDDPKVAQRIYELSREVMLFQRALAPLPGMLALLRAELAGKADQLEVRRGLRDVLDHVTQLAERVDTFRTLLQNALMVRSTLVAQQQNDDTRALTQASLDQGDQVKTISSWAAIALAPTLIAGIYGMNFTNMPELHWALGYPVALVAMVGVSTGLYVLFKRRNWI